MSKEVNTANTNVSNNVEQNVKFLYQPHRTIDRKNT